MLLSNGNNQHYVHSTMSAKEEYSLNGSLCEATIERLIEMESRIFVDDDSVVDFVDEVECRVAEAKGCFPKEDFLEPIKQELRQLNVRGDNKALLNHIIQLIDDLENENNTSVEHGYNELGLLLKSAVVVREGL